MKRNALLLLLLLATASTQLSAQATLSIQGTVQNYDGSAVDDGEYDITFKLYTVDNGGTAVWTETQSVSVTGGVYSTLLGAANPLNVSFSQVYYLGITLPGGPELIPRSRLTSAPYALSLIGQSNTFPSSGPVGVGTATPASGLGLHVRNTAAAAKLLVESTASTSTMEVLSSNGVPEVLVNSTKWENNPRLTLRRGTTGSRSQLEQTSYSWGGGLLRLRTTAPYFEILFDSSGIVPLSLNANGAVGMQTGYLATSGTWQFHVDGVEKANINENNTSIYGQLRVTGSVLTNSGVMYQYGAGSSNTYWIPANVFRNWAIDATGAVKATEFIASSDRRIKKDVNDSSKRDDLASLLGLRVVDYRMKDEVMNKPTLHKGFIAQEVAELLPEAVTKGQSVIPDIYALSERVELNGEEMTIAVKDKHGLNPGDKVRLMWEKTKAGETLYEVSRVNGENSFTVSGWTEGSTDKVFVYGREVDDFHTVNYDYIHTLNISATQELARRLFSLESENEGLRSEVKNMNERLLKLETLVTGSAQR